MRAFAGATADGPAGSRERTAEAPARRRVEVAVARFQEEVDPLARGQGEHELRPCLAHAPRRLGEHERALAPHRVESLVAEGDVAAVNLGRQEDAAALALDAAHLEHVAEIGAELEHQRQHHLIESEVAAADALVEPLALERAAALDVDGATRRAAAVDRRQRAVGAMVGEDGVVLGKGGRQARRTPVADQEDKP